MWLFFGMFIANLQRLVLVRGAAAWDLHSFFATVDSILGGAFMGTMGGFNLVHGIARFLFVCICCVFRGKDFYMGHHPSSWCVRGHVAADNLRVSPFTSTCICAR